MNAVAWKYYGPAGVLGATALVAALLGAFDWAVGFLLVMIVVNVLQERRERKLNRCPVSGLRARVGAGWSEGVITCPECGARVKFVPRSVNYNEGMGRYKYVGIIDNHQRGDL